MLYRSGGENSGYLAEWFVPFYVGRNHVNGRTLKKTLKKIVGLVLGVIALKYLLIGGFNLLIYGELVHSRDPQGSKISFTRYLPATATEINEVSWADGFIPDYNYWLRARVTREEFDQFVRDLELTPHTNDRQYSENSWLSWSDHLLGDTDWWHPTQNLEETYVREGGTKWSFAKYENGYLYFRSLDH
jgi:hypothetical protein